MRTVAMMFAATALAPAAALAQQAAPAAGEKPFAAGQPLGVVAADGKVAPMSENVKVYGSFNFTESCTFDPERNLIVASNRGATQAQIKNDAFVSLINPDGSVHTAKWIGATRDGLVLNDPLGSDLAGGKLYLADKDGGNTADEPTVSVVRIFDLKTGAPAGEIRVEDSVAFNDLAVADDGTIYGTQTGAMGPDADKNTWRVYRIAPDGTASAIVQGPPLARPNGIAFDPEGNIVVVNIESDDVLTFSPEGKLLNTEKAAQPGNDGLVIMEDGTKYVSSVRNGGISKIAPGGTAELIATGIPSAASMCYDPSANQLVIPMNPNNALAIVKLGG